MGSFCGGPRLGSSSWAFARPSGRSIAVIRCRGQLAAFDSVRGRSGVRIVGETRYILRGGLVPLQKNFQINVKEEA